jgi:6-pyruvoyl-tetrahydropterin synthase
LFDHDHQVLFEISEYEREHEDKGRIYTSKNAYEIARTAMYELGDHLKSYNNSYEEIDVILKSHRAVMENLKQILIANEISDDDIKYISYTMPHVLLFGEDRYTLVDSISFGSKDSVESHQVEMLDCAHPSTSNESFYYPDGVLVHDTVKRWIGGCLQFHLRNIIKGRKTLIIRRTDIFQGNYSVDVTIEGVDAKEMVIDGADTKQRWRNLFVIYDEGEIKDNTGIVKFSIGETGRDNSGSIWIYQML